MNLVYLVIILGLSTLSTVLYCFQGLPRCGKEALPHLEVKNLPASAGDLKDAGCMPGPGRTPGGGNGNSRILAWEIPRREEPGGLQSTGLQRTGHN